MDRKNNSKQKFILIGCIVGLVIAIGMTLFIISQQNAQQEEKPVETIKVTATPNATLQDGAIEKPVTNNNGLQIDINSYSYYPSSNGIDFSFYIVNLTVTTQDGINIDLSHFSTSENIVLNQVDSCVNTLEKNQYYLGKANVVYQLISIDNQASFAIFVPVIGNSSSINLYCDLIDGFDMVLSSQGGQTKEINSLYYSADDVVSDGKTYQLTVSKAFDISGGTMYQLNDGVLSEYVVPSTVSIFCFKLEAISLYGDTIIIEDAKYVSDNGQIFDALGANIYSEKYENILGQLIDNNTSGNLFFEAYNSYDNPISYTGHLLLYIVGQDEPITINVDLNK